MFKKMVALVLVLGLLGLLVGCGAPVPKPEPEVEAPVQEQEVEATAPESEEPAEPAPAPNAGKPLPNSDSIKQLKAGELLYSTEYSAENAGQILISFVLSADGKSAHSISVLMRSVTVINNPDTAPSPYALESVTFPGMQTASVVNGRLEYDDGTLQLALDISGDTAKGGCSINYYNDGFKFTEDMPLIEGMEYTDVPPSSLNVAEQAVTFAVAARG